jgi:hypothetical protein
MIITLTNLHTLQISTTTGQRKFFACCSVITGCCKVVATDSGDSSWPTMNCHCLLATHIHLAGSGKLLLVLTSTVTLGSKSCTLFIFYCLATLGIVQLTCWPILYGPGVSLIENTVFAIVVSVYVTLEMCLHCCWRAVTACTCSNIPSFSHHVTVFNKYFKKSDFVSNINEKPRRFN